VWALFAAPGTLWLALLFVVPFYAVMAVAFGRIDPIFRSAEPEWNPLRWNFSAMSTVLDRVFGGDLGGVFLRTFWYVGITLLLCTLIGYPIAYYVARRARRSRGVLLVLLVIPFWISYLMRMLAWSSLLERDGWVNRFLQFAGILDEPRNWLAGEPSTVILGLTYGYIPFFILPLYASLERLDERYLEAARDLGASRGQTFWRVTLPLSLPGLLAAAVITALPMFGDYYTNGYLSGSPRTEMIGNQIEFYLRNTSQPQVGASLVLILSAFLVVLMAYYLVSTNRSQRELSR
jgi:ABC-type spermidine/putrescine transport system permease subunit I